jgi:hypothetical protein
VALVITLIMLSVITFMAVTFLFVSHSERGAVATMTEQNTAGLAAETALERAKMTIIANMLTFTNPYTFSMLVSTSYVSGEGYNPGVKAATNVSYTYANGGALNQNDNLQNLANMVYDPPIPVCIVTNQLGSNENRLWLDANRNGIFDRSGLQPVTGPNGEHYSATPPYPPVQGFPANTVLLSNVFIGDPQWIGVLEKSGFPPGLSQPGSWPTNFPHSATNRAVSRYAFQVVPVGDTLDINYMFNQAKLRGPTQDGFLRNEGVGTWEDNLAAFLVDLNTNMWPMSNNPSGYARYEYFPDLATASRGAAFDDARAILRYRYNPPKGYNNLSNVFGMFGQRGVDAFLSDAIDGLTDGPLMTSNSAAVEDDGKRISFPWPGSDNPIHYFTLSELFDKNKTGVPGIGFPERMAQAGTNLSSYDQSTFYRLQQQLGVDSAPDPKDKMNINYDNLVQYHTNADGSAGVKSATNFFPWRATDFFTNAAIRLLVNAGYAVSPTPLLANQHVHTNLLVARFGVTNIQIMVYPTNLYTPSVHRLFQLAANLFDASTDRSFQVKNPVGYPTPSFPAVFRPIFQSVNGGSEIYVVGYDEVTNLTILNAATRDLTNPNERNQMKPNDMAYGVPLVVGAAKGIPNFNEFGMLTRVDVLRLLEFRRPDGGDPNVTKVNETNQMYIFGVSNVFGLEGWNSYSNPYPRNLRLIWAADMTAVMTNELSTTLLSNRVSTGSVITVSGNTWSGWVNPSFALPSFRIPAYTNFPFLTNSTYRQNPVGFVPQTHIFERTFTSPTFQSPRLMLSLNSRARFILVDDEAGRIVDYVNLNNTSDTVDVFGKLAQSANCTTVGSATYLDPASHWCTNLLNGPTAPADSITYGIINQISLGLNGGSGMVGSFSQDSSAGQDANKAVDGFRFNLMNLSPIHTYTGVQPTFFKSNVFYVPFSPYTPILIQTTWQANDPLVHYTVGDLMDLSTAQSNAVEVITKPVPTNYMVLPNIGAINGRYRPWGGNPVAGSSPSTAIGDYEMAAKDALVMRSDDWDFPTNKLPNIGWIGRVHRGTPWQTINLKSANIPFPTQTATNLADPQVGRWQRWTGNGFLVKNVGQFDLGLTNWFPLGSNAWDAVFTMGRTDPTLLDMFTTAFNDNASSGKMSVNQSGMAAWSAILSGVIVNSNINVDSWGVIQPAGYYDENNTNTWSPLVHIVRAINDIRATNFGGGFRKLGEILTVPELTVASPFINRGDLNQPLASGLTLEQQNTLSDEVYERIPQQVLGLLKGPENPRFLILSYGQALKPADRSIVSSGPFFGMVTNYQITAEVATRALVRIEGSPDPSRNEITEPDPSKRYPPRVIVEKFNQLPPD